MGCFIPALSAKLLDHSRKNVVASGEFRVVKETPGLSDGCVVKVKVKRSSQANIAAQTVGLTFAVLHGGIKITQRLI